MQRLPLVIFANVGKPLPSSLMFLRAKTEMWWMHRFGVALQNHVLLNEVCSVAMTVILQIAFHLLV